LRDIVNALCNIRMASGDRRVHQQHSGFAYQLQRGEIIAGISAIHVSINGEPFHRLSGNVEGMAKTSHQVFYTPLAMIAVDEVPHLTESSVKNQTTTSIEEAKHLYHEVLNCFMVVFTERSSEKPESRSENLMVVI